MNKEWLKAIAVLWACSLSAPAFALPSFSRVVSGEATFLWGPGTLTVTTNGDTTIEWNTFDLGATEHLYFNQSTTSNWVQNTVLGTAPVQISGTITSNGGWGMTGPAFVVDGSISADSVTLGERSSGPMPLPPSTVPISNYGPLQPPSEGVILSSGRDVSLWSSFNVGGGSVQFSQRTGGTIHISGTNGFALLSDTLDSRGSAIALVSSIPEPETYAMFLSGLALLGALARRRNQRHV